jgi:hypothetical protein
VLAGAAVALALWLHSGLKADRYAVDTGVTPAGRYVGTQRSQQVANRGVFAVKKTLFLSAHRRAPWQDPTAAFIAVAGVGAALGLAFKRI